MAIVLPAILLLAAALRLWGLGREHPFDDDYCQIYTALHPDGLAAFLRLTRGNPHHALLDPLTTFFAAKLQPVAFWARLPSALEGVAAVALAMRFAKPVGERRIALTGLLLAVSLLHAQWSRGVNFYALLTLLSILHSHLFLELLAGRRGWRAYSASACVFLHAHPYAMLFLPFHALWAWRRPAFAATLRAWGVALCLFAPWFFWSWRGLLDLELFQGAYRHSPLNIGLGEFLLHAPLHLAGVAPEVGPPARWTPGPASFAALLLATAYALSLRRSLRGFGSHSLNYAHALFAYGFLCVVVLDRAYGYFYSPRQLLWLFPFYLYGAADGLCLLAERLRRPTLGLAAFAVATVALALPLHAAAIRWRVDARERHEEFLRAILARARPGDRIAFHHYDVLVPVLYFLDRDSFFRHGDLRLRDGVWSYGLPREGTRIQTTAGELEVVIGDPPDDARVWRFSGHPYDMTVRPPLLP